MHLSQAYAFLHGRDYVIPDDIAALEDLPNVPGGSRRRASLNYVPLDLWPELSKQRHGGMVAGEE